jgi:UDP-N-acetylmuramoyl-L-alanyl-D-glutamate--2,6-diaminopimelate ligase
MRTLATLLENLPAYTLEGDALSLDRVPTSVQYDSRECTAGAVFVAIRGLQSDGHDFIAQAIERGAHVVVAEREVAELDCEVPLHITFVRVANSRIALALLSHAWFGEPSVGLRIIGVTGTNGKTTTTFILQSLLESMGETVGIIGTTGNYIRGEMLPAQFTTPEAPELCALFVEMKRRGATTIVMEVSSHALALHRVDGTIFAGAIFTNLTQDHLDFHETMDAYAEAKKRLFCMLPPHAVAVVNADDNRGMFMLEGTEARTQVLFGRSERAGNSNAQPLDVRIADQRLGFAGTEVELTVYGEEMHASMPLIGAFNVDNLAACVAMAHALGASLSVLSHAIRQLHGAPGRMQRVSIANGMALAIVDYAHTPDALEKALLSCRELLQSPSEISIGKPERTSASTARLICVVGCGGNRDRTKRPLMGAIATRLADVVILTSDNPRNEDPLTILDDILAGVPAGNFASTIVLADRREAIRRAVTEAQNGDIVLIAGKGHETYQIVGSTRLHFDDVEEIEQAQM